MKKNKIKVKYADGYYVAEIGLLPQFVIVKIDQNGASKLDVVNEKFSWSKMNISEFKFILKNTNPPLTLINKI